MPTFEDKMCETFGCRKPDVVALWHKTKAEKRGDTHATLGAVAETLRKDFGDGRRRR